MDSRYRNWKVIAATLFVLALIAVTTTLKLLTSDTSHGQARMAEWQEEGRGRYVIHSGLGKSFRFDGRSDRVLVSDAPQFHFGTNRDFSVEAWIKAYPTSSGLARRLGAWLQGHAKVAGFIPAWLSTWISTHSSDNDFGVTPIVDKHQTPSTIESVGFQLYLDHGRLACQLSQAPMRQLGFQNFVSSAPGLQDGHWHHVAMAVKRSSHDGGKLYVDGQQVLTFDATAQSGDLSNSQPLRIGNHANPNLRCFFKGIITGVELHDGALSDEKVAATCNAGRPR
jgi:hypothetical protein